MAWWYRSSWTSLLCIGAWVQIRENEEDFFSSIIHSALCLSSCLHYTFSMNEISFRSEQYGKAKNSKLTNPTKYSSSNISSSAKKQITHTSYATLPVSPRSRRLLISRIIANYLQEYSERIPCNSPN